MLNDGQFGRKKAASFSEAAAKIQSNSGFRVFLRIDQFDDAIPILLRPWQQ